MIIIKYINHGKKHRMANNKYLLDETGLVDVVYGKSFKLFGTFFYLYLEKTFFWFRFFNKWGLWGRKNTKDRFVLFSERMGYTKTYKLFGWVFKPLK